MNAVAPSTQASAKMSMTEALRAEAASGAVTFPALLIDAARLRVEGGGTVDLGAETLACSLHPWGLALQGLPPGVSDY